MSIMYIPEYSFEIYIVFSRIGMVMSVHQTFEQALDRISELLKSDYLYEEYFSGVDRLRYRSEKNHDEYYDIYHAHFLYDEKRPLVTKWYHSFDQEDEKSVNPTIRSI